MINFGVLSGDAIEQGFFYGCLIWLVTYSFNRGYLFFKRVAS